MQNFYHVKLFKQSVTKFLCTSRVQKQHKSQRACTQHGTNKEEKWESNEMQQDIVILCESPYVYLPIKYYNRNISSWRESFTALNMTCCLNAERRMTDSCSRRKLSFCKLKFNNVNIILSLTLRYGMASDDIGYTVDENQTGALLFLLV